MYNWPGEQKQWIKLAEWHDFWKSSEARWSSQWVSAQANCWWSFVRLSSWAHSSSRTIHQNVFPILMQGHASPPIPHTLPKQQHHHHIVSNGNDWKTDQNPFVATQGLLASHGRQEEAVMLWDCIVMVCHQGLVQKSEVKGQHKYKWLEGGLYSSYQGVCSDH